MIADLLNAESLNAIIGLVITLATILGLTGTKLKMVNNAKGEMAEFGMMMIRAMKDGKIDQEESTALAEKALIVFGAATKKEDEL